MTYWYSAGTLASWIESGRQEQRCLQFLATVDTTNYISLDVLEAIEAAMLVFPGPVIAVSHDRCFIQRFGGTLWALVDGKIVEA